jgi:hypothetical protein
VIASGAGMGDERRRGRFHVPASLVAPAIVGAGAAGLFLWRTLSWPSASSFDAWAYAAWGQHIAGVDRLVYNTGTTPKPLASVLGAVVSPLPPARAMAVVVALALGILAAALFAAAERRAGPVAAAVSVGAFALAADLEPVLWFSLIDAATAALVVLSLALAGRGTVGSLVLSGLLRPEGWVASGVAGYVESAGSRVRRLALAAGAGVLPLALWVAFDLVTTGDPLATWRFREEVGAELGQGSARSIGETLRLFKHQLLLEGGTLLLAVGGVGLVVHAIRARTSGWNRAGPLVLALVWSAVLMGETQRGLELNARYLLPVVALLALGCGLLAGTLAPVRTHARWRVAAAAATLAITGLAVAQMEFGKPAERWQARGRATLLSVPAIERVLQCGRVGVSGRRYVRGTISQLAAATRAPLASFVRAESGAAAGYAGVLQVGGLGSDELPPWPRMETALGPLAVNPTCAVSGGGGLSSPGRGRKPAGETGEVGLDHHLDELVEGDAGLPAEHLAGARGVAHEPVDFSRAHE